MVGFILYNHNHNHNKYKQLMMFVSVAVVWFVAYTTLDHARSLIATIQYHYSSLLLGP